MSVVKLHLVEETTAPAKPTKAKTVRAKARVQPASTKPEQVDSQEVKPRKAEPEPEPKTKTKTKTKTKKREALVSDVMTTPAVACGVHASLNEAAHLMWEHDLGAIAVVNDAGEPVSMITDRDICMAAYTQGIPLFYGTVASAMSKKIIRAELDTSIAALHESMLVAQVRRVPVVDATGKLVGIVGITDLMKEAHGSLPAERKRGSTAPMLAGLMHGMLEVRVADMSPSHGGLDARMTLEQA